MEPAHHPGIGWRELIGGAGLTQAEMSRRVHTSAKHMNQICQGKVLPGVDLVVAMARVLAAEKPESVGDMGWLMFREQARYVYEQAVAKQSDE